MQELGTAGLVSLALRQVSVHAWGRSNVMSQQLPCKHTPENQACLHPKQGSWLQRGWAMPLHARHGSLASAMWSCPPWVW